MQDLWQADLHGLVRLFLFGPYLPSPHTPGSTTKIPKSWLPLLPSLLSNKATSAQSPSLKTRPTNPLAPDGLSFLPTHSTTPRFDFYSYFICDLLKIHLFSFTSFLHCFQTQVYATSEEFEIKPLGSAYPPQASASANASSTDTTSSPSSTSTSKSGALSLKAGLGAIGLATLGVAGLIVWTWAVHTWRELGIWNSLGYHQYGSRYFSTWIMDSYDIARVLFARLNFSSTTLNLLGVVLMSHMSIKHALSGVWNTLRWGQMRSLVFRHSLACQASKHHSRPFSSNKFSQQKPQDALVETTPILSSSSDFALLAGSGMFVDKSPAIQDFLRHHMPIHLLLRPRRSGKTTLLCMFR